MPPKINVKSQAGAKPAPQRVRPPKLTDVNGQSMDRRSQIVESAAKLFAEYGYEATSVRQIADAVGMLPGSLYHHFATKEEMLHEVMTARLRKMSHDNQRIAHLPVDAEHRFIASVIMRFRQYVENWEFHSILLQEGRFFRRHQDFAYVVEAKTEAFAVQQLTLREGMEAGLFRSDMDTYLMIGAISRLLSSAAAWFRSGDIFSSDRPSHYLLEDMIDFHVDSVLRLVRAPSRIAEPIPRAICESLLLADDNEKVAQ
jgi:TetR/AcrR family transcriptional regulator, cholesterol catabolism regulator